MSIYNQKEEAHIPSRSSVVPLSKVVHTFTMAALPCGLKYSKFFLSTGGFRSYQVEDLVSNSTASLKIQFGDLSMESLPLGGSLFRIVVLVGLVCSPDQTEI